MVQLCSSGGSNWTRVTIGGRDGPVVLLWGVELAPRGVRKPRVDDSTSHGSIDDAIFALAARQHGVVTRAQLLAAGLTRGMVATRRGSGQLHRLHRGVYLLGGLRGPLEPERAREMAAVLASGSTAVLSHRSAAWLWGALPRPGPATPVDVTVPRHSRTRRPAVRVHRSRDLPPHDTTRLDGIPVTTPARTLRDLSLVVGARDLDRAAARLERRRLIGSKEIEALPARHRGRPGARLLRAALPCGDGPTLTRSTAEERFLDIVRRGRLPRPRTNVVVRGHEVDFFWPEEKLVVEVDGFAFHASRHSFENDRRRDAELAAAGLRVVRVTWRQIAKETDVTLVRVAQALARGGPS